MNFNLHTHTNFCDGKAEPEAYVEKALELGFHTLGFSGHAPVPFENNFSIEEKDFQKYIDVINSLRKKYKDQIKILLALEIDFIPTVTQNFSEFIEKGNLDYTIGGVHLVRNNEKQGLWFIDGSNPDTYDDGLQKIFNGNIRKGVEAYYHQIREMTLTQNPDIIAHLDKIKMHNNNRYFSGKESWYKDSIWKCLKTFLEAGSIVEVNTRGIYKKRFETTFPEPEVLEQILHLNIPITMNSDAHHPDELDARYTETIELLKDIGFKDLVFLSSDGWKTQGI